MLLNMMRQAEYSPQPFTVGTSGYFANQSSMVRRLVDDLAVIMPEGEVAPESGTIEAELAAEAKKEAKKGDKKAEKKEKKAEAKK